MSVKKNVVPLVIIALVVAVAATGIFYGLIVSRMEANTAVPALRPVAVSSLEKGHTVQAADFRLAEVKSNEPGPLRAEDLVGRVLEERLESGAVFTDRLLSKLRQRNLKGEIPNGMRAVTMHVSDSSSVLAMVEAGDRVDVQSVMTKQAPGGSAEVSAKTILENVTIYALAGNQEIPHAQPRGVLTVLVSPAEAERLAGADAASRLRIALRNRQDQALSKATVHAPAPQAVVTSNFRPKAPAGPTAFPENPSREFEVHLVEVESVEIAGPEANWTEKLEEWKASRKGAVWASSKLDVARGGEVTWRGSNPEATLRVRLESQNWANDGSVDVRILSEAQKRTEKRVHLAKTQSTLVSGFVPKEQLAAWKEKFAPGRPASSANSELVLVVSPSPRR